MHAINLKATILISIFVVIYFLISLKGISTNHSFWSDEAFVSSIARDTILGKINLSAGSEFVGYQRMQLFTSILSFKIFGISEWSARFPSVLWGSIGVIIAFILTKKLSNLWGGFLAAFLYTILQLNHAYSTQAKPYTAIEVIMLIVIYLSSLVSEDFKNRRIHILSIFFASTASLYNTIGVITFVPYFATVSRDSKKSC